ncbi:MAG: hypothetical protein ABWK01_01805, partial [Infirmifilum sp.]
DDIIKGKSSRRGDSNIIEAVETINLADLKNRGEIRMEVVNKNGYFRIKYGSPKLFSEIRRFQSRETGKPYPTTTVENIIAQLQKSYDESLAREGRKAYRVNDLGYVWYCYRGYAMSTDPYDYGNCPFMLDCQIGKALQGNNKKTCPNWSRSRKLFPKVYMHSERRTSLKRVHEQAAFGLISAVAGNGVPLWEDFLGAQWFMPGLVQMGIAVEAEFEHPVAKELAETNVVGISLPISLLKALISELIDEHVKPKPPITIASHDKGKLTLDQLLLSKFVIYRLSDKGLSQLSLLTLGPDTLIKRAKKEYIRTHSEASIRAEAVDYFIDVFAHTLAHLFYVFLSSRLEIEPENLIYVYQRKDEEDRLYVMVAENSPYGVIDLPNHVLKHFKSYDNMISQFINSTLHNLSMHDKNMKEFKKKTLNNKRLKKAKLKDSSGEKILLRDVGQHLEDKWYFKFVENHVVFDLPTFEYYMFLREDEKRELSKELGIKSDDLSEKLKRKLPAIIRDNTSIHHCIDGCSACVILDRNCHSPLTQNLTTSKHLANWLLKVFSGKETFYARGEAVLPALLRAAKREVIILSPYLDEDGVKILGEAAKSRVNILVATREEAARVYGKKLSDQGVRVVPLKESGHYKLIIIDRTVLVHTSQNFSGLRSVNSFTITVDPERAKALVEQVVGANVGS